MIAFSARSCGWPFHWQATLLAAAVLALLSGCSRGPKIVPVQGKVLLNGEPLKFGSVMFQPAAGQPARAEIQPDGSFRLTTNTMHDGGTVGHNRVRVTCYEAQRPNAAAGGGELPLGRSLIPKHYGDIHTSNLTVNVVDGPNEGVVVELTK
jgi:hypothetical protein